jgi:hypothetical protein
LRLRRSSSAKTWSIGLLPGKNGCLGGALIVNLFLQLGALLGLLRQQPLVGFLVHDDFW